jgi:hypothetical protein
VDLTVDGEVFSPAEMTFSTGGRAYMVSEFEGQRPQDAFETDSCEQVRRQHLMLKRLLGEG